MLQRTHLIRVLMVAILLTLTSSAEKADTRSLRYILSKQGFTGLLKGNVTFTLLGNMKCNSRMLHAYYYTWEETNPPGLAIHFSRRLIFIENRSYVGQYVVSDHPVLAKPDLLRFPYSQENGNAIKCDRDGLPKSVTLDGESHDLFR